MGLLWEGGQQHRRRTVAARVWNGLDSLTQQTTDAFCVEMLFVHCQITTRPSCAHHAGQWRNQIHHKTLQAVLRQGFQQLTTQGLVVLALQHLDVAHQIRTSLQQAFIMGGLQRSLTTAEVLQCCQGLCNDAPRTMTLVHQAFDHPKLFNLRHGVGALTVGISAWHRKAIAALPDAQRILADAGIAFNCCNRERHL